MIDVAPLSDVLPRLQAVGETVEVRTVVARIEVG